MSKLYKKLFYVGRIFRGAVFIFCASCFQHSALCQSTGRTGIMIELDVQYVEPYRQEMEGRKAALIQQIEAEVKKNFPCADVQTKDAMSRRLEADKKIAENGGKSDLDDITAGMATRYVFSFTLSKTDADLYAFSGKDFDMRGFSVGDGSSVETGASANINTMVKHVIEKLTIDEICPWKGNITVTRTIRLDTIKNECCYTNNSLFKFTDMDKVDEHWDIEKVGRTRSKGTVHHKRDKMHQEEAKATGDIPCFIQGKEGPCSIIDNKIPGKFEHVLSYQKSKVEGTRHFDNAVVTVTFNPAIGRYFINIKSDFMAVGLGTGEEYEMYENSCRKCESKNEKSDSYSTVVAGWLVGGTAKLSDQQLSGNFKDKTMGLEIEWNLHR